MTDLQPGALNRDNSLCDIWIRKDRKYPHFCLLQIDSIMLQTSGIITRQTRFLDNVIGQT